MKTEQFKRVYDYCQTLAPEIPFEEVLKKVLDVACVDELELHYTALNTETLRGFFLGAEDVDHPYLHFRGKNLIVLATGMRTCWERFVIVKEAMHLFDDDHEKVNNRMKFERFLNDWGSPSYALSKSSEHSSDLNAVYMALACLCPESARLEFGRKFQIGQIDAYGIASKFRVPEQYVSTLLRDDYQDLIAPFLAI